MVIMDCPIGDLFRINSTLMKGLQSCEVSCLRVIRMATCKRSKQAMSDPMARIQFAEHFNVERYSM